MDGGRVILHVDMDAFYAAVEVRDDPSLRGVPVVVGADPRGGRGRGVVCTASYEARQFGIRSAMPIAQAYRACPHARFLPPDFRKYAAESGKVMAILARYAGALEVVGLDEAYLDVTEAVRGEDGRPDWDHASSLARSLQAAVKRELRLSCSVGVAPSKSLAKVASDARKPHGVVRIRPEEAAAFLDPLPVGKLHGCGPKTAAALRGMGITTAGELAATPRRDLEARFGSHGAWLHRIACGDDPRTVDPDRGERKSRGNETTFQRDECDAQRVAEVAAGLLDELLDDARRDGRPFSTVTVKIRYGDFSTLTRARTLELPACPTEPHAAGVVHEAVSRLLGPLLDGRPVRLVGVRLSSFQDGPAQRALPSFGLEWAGLAEPSLHGALAGAGQRQAPHWTTLGQWSEPPAAR